MSLAVCIPVLNQPDCTQETLSRLKALQKRSNNYIIVDNGSTPPVREWLMGLEETDLIIRNHKNKGLPKALNQALLINRQMENDYLFCTHTDVLMFEQDWDQKTLDAIGRAGNVGVAGYFGALGIGTGDIYTSPYMMQQLARTYPISGSRCKLDPRVHGQIVFEDDFAECAVLDGFSLIVKSDLKFDEKYTPHHMYDNDICLESIKRGHKNIVINIDVNHLGGRTDVGEDWASAFGKTKQQIHQDSHPIFYEKWRGTLPFKVG